MSNKWVNALVKTLIFLVVVHLIVWVISLFIGGAMIWPHLTSLWGILIGIVGAVISYFVIYAWFTGPIEAE